MPGTRDAARAAKFCDEFSFFHIGPCAMRTLLKVAGGLVVALVVLVGAYIAANWAPDRPVEELKAQWAPPPSQFVDVAGMSAHLRDEGPREDPLPVVLLHGTSASLHTWDGWTQALSARHRVIRFDLPGFGLTGPAPDHVYTLDSYVKFVVAVIDKLGVQRCVLGGNSFGGNIAWATAVLHPDRVGKLILVDAGGYPVPPQSVPIGFRIAQMPVLGQLMKNVLPRRVIEDSLRNVYGDPAKVTPERVDLYYDITTRAGNRAALRERMKHWHHGEMVERIPQVKAPTLIIWGGRDRLIPPESGQRFRAEIPDSRLVRYDELGHVPQEEDPAGTVPEVQHFLAQG